MVYWIYFRRHSILMGHKPHWRKPSSPPPRTLIPKKRTQLPPPQITKTTSPPHSAPTETSPPVLRPTPTQTTVATAHQTPEMLWFLRPPPSSSWISSLWRCAVRRVPVCSSGCPLSVRVCVVATPSSGCFDFHIRNSHNNQPPSTQYPHTPRPVRDVDRPWVWCLRRRWCTASQGWLAPSGWQIASSPT